MTFFTRLPEELVVHDDRHVHKLKFGQQVKQRFADIQNGDFAAPADGKPFLCHFDSHSSSSHDENAIQNWIRAFP